MALRIEDVDYPNPAYRGRQVFNGAEPIGIYHVVEGGFLPGGCRKRIKSERDAQLKKAAIGAQLYEEL